MEPRTTMDFNGRWCNGLLALGLGLVTATVGCGNKKKAPICERLAQRVSKCQEHVALEEAQVLKGCRLLLRKTKAMRLPIAECLKIKGCKAFGKCFRDLNRYRERLDKVQQVKGLIAQKKTLRALEVCVSFASDYRGGDTVCQPLAESVMKGAKGVARKVADPATGSLKKRIERCHTVELAEKVVKKGNVDFKLAVLCRSLEHSQKPLQVIAEAKRWKRNDRLPQGCYRELKMLRMMNTAYGKSITKRFLDACFVKIGVRVLAAQVPKLKERCTRVVWDIYAQLIKDPTRRHHLIPWLARLRKVCPKAPAIDASALPTIPGARPRPAPVGSAPASSMKPVKKK